MSFLISRTGACARSLASAGALPVTKLLPERAGMTRPTSTHLTAIDDFRALAKGAGLCIEGQWFLNRASRRARQTPTCSRNMLCFAQEQLEHRAKKVGTGFGNKAMRQQRHGARHMRQI